MASLAKKTALAKVYTMWEHGGMGCMGNQKQIGVTEVNNMMHIMVKYEASYICGGSRLFILYLPY
jgi:hypothetical protein